MIGKRLEPEALDVPDVFKSDDSALEILRFWASSGNACTFTLQTVNEDPGALGIPLVDIAHHATNAYAERGQNPEWVSTRIKTLFDAEWNSPTDETSELK